MKYTRETIKEIYEQRFMDLMLQAIEVHRQHHDASKIKLCAATSIKTGGCPENCSFCPQSAHYKTFVEKSDVMDIEKVRERALHAKSIGANRMCLGGAWGKVPKGESFRKVIAAVEEVKGHGLEVCCSIGTLDGEQIGDLQSSGCDVVNHNIDTSEEFYDKVITTRTFNDRLTSIKKLQSSGMNVCCGGIVGMGESRADRYSFLETLCALDPTPESVPLNSLTAIEGTPLGNQEPMSALEYLRMVATTRIVLPESIVALAAGRHLMSEEMQAFCFLIGANSIIVGDKKILTTPNPDPEKDFAMLETLNLNS